MAVSKWRYAFPRYALETCWSEQMDHIEGELEEAVYALSHESRERAAEELMDVVHAAETALRMLEDEGVDLDAVKKGVVRKNRARGYYAETIAGKYEPRKVYKLDKASLEILAEYPSAYSAEWENGMPAGSIAKTCQRRKVSKGPFVWRYADDYDPRETFEGKYNRPLAAIDAKTGDLLMFFDVAHASEKLAVAPSSISKSMSSEKMLLDRYVFRYAR